jgi:anaerobic selenocysteine-containing dehydrogenase
MFSYVRLSDGGPARHAGPRSEIQVVSQLARLVLGVDGPVDWPGMENTGRIRQAIARIVPGYERIGEIDVTKQEFQIEGRTFHEPKFPTATGRARLFTHDLPELAAGDGQLRLMTVRSEGQFNTVVYEDYDLYRGIDRRDVILLHPDDLARLGLTDDQLVDVFNDTGRMTNLRARAYADIKPGNALVYYPEANVLVPRVADPQSRTPAFKCVLATVAAANGNGNGRGANDLVRPEMPDSLERKGLKSC